MKWTIPIYTWYRPSHIHAGFFCGTTGDSHSAQVGEYMHNLRMPNLVSSKTLVWSPSAVSPAVAPDFSRWFLHVLAAFRAKVFGAMHDHACMQ